MTSPTVDATRRFEQQLTDPAVQAIIARVHAEESDHCAAVAARVLDAIVELDDAVRQLVTERARVARRVTEEPGLSRGSHADHLFGLADAGVSMFDLTNRPVLALADPVVDRIRSSRPGRISQAVNHRES